ncbi:hypothetical protein [Hymenobacter negativus]|uniref:Glycosyltransferase RgtA/B/C/D-like domain-containing protein n=1 Tax=Hymenobacter negativus TaxID=2795026 RepID=A0ABS3QDC1_9BACT|nr:hypothetical protein [Hymenobacter negativus]MBO2009003.1 hypothetical protein [Hymenobacter negativus]
MSIPTPSARPTARPWLLKRWVVRQRGSLIGLALALALLPFFALSFYNAPFWDDFGMALMVRQQGFWQAQKAFYLNWGGRYATCFIQTLGNPLSYGWLGGTHFVPLLILSGTLAVLYFSLRELSGRRLSHGAAGRGAALLLLLCLAWMPTIYPLFYWFCASTGYQLGIILMLLIPVAGLRALRTSGWKSWSWYGLAQLSAVVVVGLNEIALLLLGWMLLVLLASTWRSGLRRAATCWGGLLVTAVVAGTVAVLAPGNWVRMYGTTGKATAVSVHLGTVLRYGGENIVAFLTKPTHVVALLSLPVLLGPLLVRVRHWRPAGFRLPLPAGMAVLLMGVGLSFLFHAFITPNPPPGRTSSFIWLWLFLGWAAVLWAAVPTQVPAAVRRALRYSQQLATGLTLLLLAAGVERNAWTEWLRNAPTWRAQNEARFAQMQAAARRGQRVLVVAPFSGIVPRHVSILGENLFHHPNNSFQHHNNDVTAHWFGLDSVDISGHSAQGRVGEGL